MGSKYNWDVIGIATSVACAIHCALMPIVISSLPFLGIIHNAVFEWMMIVIAFVVGCYSLYHGYIKHHQNLLPLLLFCIGFIFLLLKQFYNYKEIWFLLPAVILIISAHYLNYKLCRKSKCSSEHHVH